MNKIINYYDSLAESYDENRFDNTYGKFIDKQERNILDKLLTTEYYGGIGSYIDIASEIVVDNGISVEKLKEVLLNWIYNEPFLKRKILIETPKAEVELLYPIANVTFSEL